MPLSRANASAREAAVAIARRLRDNAHTAYLAGGCVRDELLGLHPKDYDIATDAPPDRVAALFRNTRAVGKAFGVMLVREAGHVVEVATFRADSVYSDRRRPDAVTFADARADAARRDFTINVIFLDPLDPTPAEPTGRVIDYVGGRADLAARTVRAVGDPDARLSEDHLRALRAVRFAARLGFTIDPPTSAAIRRHATELAGVSRERIGDELRRMLSAPSRAPAARLLHEHRLDGPALGEPCAPIAHTPLLAALPPHADFVTALAAWALDRAGADSAEGALPRWRRALCLSNDERDACASALGGYRTMTEDWLRLSVAKKKRALAAESSSRTLFILRAADPAQADLIDADRAEFERDGIGVCPAPLITGDDLVAAGFVPGPAFAACLAGVYDAQLEGRVGTREAAMAAAREWLG